MFSNVFKITFTISEPIIRSIAVGVSVVESFDVNRFGGSLHVLLFYRLTSSSFHLNVFVYYWQKRRV